MKNRQTTGWPLANVQTVSAVKGGGAYPSMFSTPGSTAEPGGLTEAMVRTGSEYGIVPRTDIAGTSNTQQMKLQP